MTVTPGVTSERSEHAANLWRRGIAFSVDLVVIAAIAALLLIPFHIVLFALGIRHMSAGEIIASAGILSAIVWGYFTSLETLIGATMGKLACGLTVVCTDTGEKPSLAQASLRNLWRIPEAVPFGVPALVAITASPRGQRIGDRRAGTLVVRR